MVDGESHMVEVPDTFPLPRAELLFSEIVWGLRAKILESRLEVRMSLRGSLPTPSPARAVSAGSHHVPFVWVI